MVDPNLPLELDDGREVKLVGANEASIEVQFEGSPVRKGIRSKNEYWDNPPRAGISWSYQAKTGVFYGGSAKEMCVLRNRDNPDDYLSDFDGL